MVLHATCLIVAFERAEKWKSLVLDKELGQSIVLGQVSGKVEMKQR